MDACELRRDTKRSIRWKRQKYEAKEAKAKVPTAWMGVQKNLQTVSLARRERRPPSAAVALPGAMHRPLAAAVAAVGDVAAAAAAAGSASNGCFCCNPGKPVGTGDRILEDPTQEMTESLEDLRLIESMRETTHLAGLLLVVYLVMLLCGRHKVSLYSCRYCRCCSRQGALRCSRGLLRAQKVHPIGPKASGLRSLPFYL